MKLKSKILFPIVGVTALSASVAPALVGCNNKAEVEIKQFDVRVDQKTSAWGVDFIEGQGARVIEADKNKDLSVSFEWTPNQAAQELLIDKLYASSLTIVVSGSPIGPATKEKAGYEIKLRQQNKLVVEIQKECFDWEAFPTPIITFHLEFSIDYVDVNVDVDEFDTEYYEDDGVTYDCLHSKPTDTSGSVDGTTFEFAADLSKWSDGDGPKLNSIYLAVLESDGSGGKKMVTLRETGTAYLGMKALATHVVGGFVMLDAPEGGWNVEQPLNIYIDFYESHTGLELILAEPSANVMNVTSKISNTNGWIIDPEFVNCVPYYDNSGNYVTTIKWNPQGITQTLYASGKAVWVNSVPVPAYNPDQGVTLGYTITEELSNNQFTISIPKDFMVEAGGKLELELELYMSESEIDDDVTLEEFTNDFDISEFGQCSMLKTQPTDIVAGEAIDFHAPLMNWGGTVPGNTEVPTNNFFLLGLFESNGDMVPITETGAVYYGTTKLETDINNGYMMIYGPESGWGTKVEDLQDLHLWMQFEESHEGATVAILQPNEAHTPVKMNFIDTGSWLVVEPIVKYSALTFGQSDEFFETEVQLVPQGRGNVIIPSYSVTYVNAPGGSRVLEEGKDYTVSGFKNNSKTFVFTNGLFTNVATPELTIRGNVQNPSVESFAGAMDNFAVEHAGHANCFFSKEFAVTGTIPLIDSTYVECQIQLFNWGNESAKLDDVTQFEVQLWDVTNNRQINITQVGGSGIFDDNSVYYRQNNNTLDYSFSNGHIIINRDGTSWGGMPGTIHFSIQFADDHSKLELRAFPREA